jgi:ribose transport system substrate-binding protein
MKTRTCSRLLLAAVMGVALADASHADTKNMRIAFSNNYAGNSWRQAMLKSWDIVTKKAVADKIVAAARVYDGR